MNGLRRKIMFFGGAYAASICLSAETVSWYSSVDNQFWIEGKKIQLENTQKGELDLSVSGNEDGVVFQRWGSCMNELDWDALNIIPEKDREEFMKRLYAPDGDLKFNAGRIAMGASDYARSWYSCDEVPGDLTLKYFNIDRDKTTVIPYIKSAQKYNPDMKFWASPWSPPSWMKINNYYSVRSDARVNEMDPRSDIHLFGENNVPANRRVFPPRLAVNDTFIQDPRYLKAYAQYFCKYISAFKEQGVPITGIAYQNEAYSYTVYPGCAWTPESTIKFNVEYLAPALEKAHPDVEIYIGTFNTNRYELVEKILDGVQKIPAAKSIALQWEGGQILSKLRKKYPQMKYVASENECGNGAFDWSGGERTFELINHYIGNGCVEYYLWNTILQDKGLSHWGWSQNALVQVNSKEKTARYTADYYAVKHYSHFINEGSKILGYKEVGQKRVPILVATGRGHKFVVVAGNLSRDFQEMNIRLGDKYLKANLPAHSFHTFVVD